ncbi:hypothetical protein Ddc_20119 [Ditylenchus destructor]|nr:hypothetical protein Ddc_20119 [Ditylenchus destructor]
MTPIDSKKVSPNAHVPNSTIIGPDERRRAIASAAKSGATRSPKQVRADLGAQMRTCRNGLPGGWALTAVALPTPVGARVLSLDMSKGRLPDSDPLGGTGRAGARSASACGRQDGDREAARRSAEDADHHRGGHLHHQQPSAAGPPGIDVGRHRPDGRERSWRLLGGDGVPARTAAAPGESHGASRQGRDVLGARHGGALADKSITPGVALIHEGRPQQLAPALAAIGLLRDGASIEQAVEGIRAARKAAHRRAAPRHVGPLPPAPPDPSAARPVPRPAARSGPDGVRLTPSPVIQCPAERPSASSVKKDSGIRLDPLPVIRMPPPEWRDLLNRRAFDAVSRAPRVRQAMQDLSARMARSSGPSGWCRLFFPGEDAVPLDRLARRLVKAVDLVLGGPGRAGAGSPRGAAAVAAETRPCGRCWRRAFVSFPSRSERGGGPASSTRAVAGGRPRAEGKKRRRDRPTGLPASPTHRRSPTRWGVLKTVAARVPTGSGMAPARPQD